MSPAAYQSAARRFINPVLSERDRLLESALGIAEEVGEMATATTRPELILEIGDVCWHVAQLCDLTGASFYHIWIGTNEHQSLYLTKQAAYIVACEIAGKVKKHAFKGQPLDISAALYTLADIVSRLAVYANTTMPEIWAMNIAKLEARYPNGFTVAASVNRSGNA